MEGGMPDYVTLLGADDVRVAGNRMSSAADTMRSAAGSIDDSLRQHQQFLERWLQEFSSVLEQHKEKSHEG
jgi:hypothetical protein